MILREATIKYSGKDPNILKSKSHTRICVSCDECGRVRWISKQGNTNLCRSCVHKGKIVSEETKQKLSDLNSGSNHPFYGKHHSEETKQKMHDSSIGISKSEEHKKNISINKIQFYKNNISSLTGIPKSDEHKANMSKNHADVNGSNNPNWQGGIAYDRSHVLPINKCICLNKRFDNSNFHHITKSIGIFIPKELHEHIWHSLKNGNNVGEMNMLSLQYLNGGLEI